MITRHLLRTLGARSALAGIVCLLATTAAAQSAGAPGEPIVSQARPLTSPSGATFLAVPAAVERRPLKLTVDWLADASVDAVPQDERVAAEDRPRPAWRIVLGAAVGGVGGFFGGGYLGAAIEGDGCHCDDPGLKGFLIGAPIGATVGAIVGGKYF